MIIDLNKDLPTLQERGYVRALQPLLRQRIRVIDDRARHIAVPRFGRVTQRGDQFYLDGKWAIPCCTMTINQATQPITITLHPPGPPTILTQK